MMSYVIPYDFYIQVRRINGKLCLRKIRESAFTQQSGNSILATMGLLFEERATTPVYADRSTPDEHEQFSLDMTSNLSCNGETLRLYYSAEIDSFLPNHSREWQPVNAPSPKTAVSRHFLPNQPGQLPRFNVRTNRLYFQMSKTDREKAFDFVGTDPLSQDRHRLLLKTLSTIPPLPSAVEIKMVKKNGNQRYWESKFQKVFAQCYTAGILNAFFGYQTIHRSPPAEPKPKTLSVDQYEFFTLPELLDHSRLDLSRCLWNMFHTLKWLGTVAPTDGSSVLAVFSVETREFHIEAFPQDLFDHDLPTLHDWSFVDTLLAPTLSLRGIPKSCSDVEGIIRSTVDPASLVKVSVSDDAVNSSSLMALLTFTTHQSLQQATSALKGALFDGQNVTCSPVS
ncbi:hypothetical protein BLNAU_7566 [Blattamonas nauphoetae]|uniref:Uncharacterized protein n=1 Tax=Blattamonas nauphoetae TaxID=2049346 RepID=A0ABQ9Y0Y7_9EUKA|nr:hypothetical protein BLNAU_7566 [Blattamonas nauphoetae]